MVLESEWCRDADGIHYDFEKLLVAKAPIKVMIFQNHKDNLDALWAMLAEGILRYRNHDLGETFVLAAFQNETQKFVIKHGNHVEIFRA